MHWSLKIWHPVATILIIFLRINWPNLNCPPNFLIFAPNDFCDAFCVAGSAFGRPCPCGYAKQQQQQQQIFYFIYFHTHPICVERMQMQWWRMAEASRSAEEICSAFHSDVWSVTRSATTNERETVCQLKWCHQIPCKPSKLNYNKFGARSLVSGSR